MATGSKTLQHSNASFNHFFDRSFSHRSDPEHFTFQMVLSPNHLGVEFLFEFGSPAIINPLGVHDLSLIHI